MDRPIIFSASMVRALLDGRKFQTRRIIKKKPALDALTVFGPSMLQQPGCADLLNYRVGDRLDPTIKVEGFTDYAVGISGAVYSKRRGVWQRMSPARNSNGYLAVSLIKEAGSYKTAAVHRLVCEAFHGPKPSPAHQVRHLNGDRGDSRAANLCWGTQAENWGDRRAHGNGCEGEKHPAAVLTDLEREHIAWAVDRGLCSQRHAAAALGMSQSTIQAICSARAPAPGHEAPDMSRFNITLTVTDVRVQRLQEISETDALAEGSPLTSGSYLHSTWFRELWDSLHGAGAWAANPWVVAITFTVEHENIDTRRAA